MAQIYWIVKKYDNLPITIQIGFSQPIAQQIEFHWMV
jgi:hypothetical protein